MPDYQLYLFKNLSTKEIQLLEAVKARGVELDQQMDQLQATGVCDQTWLEQGRIMVSLGINCIVRSISKQGGF